jgi:hypothetical protein
MEDQPVKRESIPRGEAGRIAWMSNFAAFLSAHGAAYGFGSAEIAAFTASVADAAAAFGNHAAQQAAARAATTAKNSALAAAMELSRSHGQRLQHLPNVTNEARAAAGLKIPDTTPTAPPADLIRTIPPPLLLLDFSVRRQVTVHWGPNPANERENGRPAGVGGCQIQAARGGIPQDEAGWTELATTTRSPHIHAVRETTPTTYAYRVRYIGTNYAPGPFGDPAVCTINV